MKKIHTCPQEVADGCKISVISRAFLEVLNEVMGKMSALLKDHTLIKLNF